MLINLYKNREWFYENYVLLKKDFRELSKESNCGYNTIRRWRKKLNIPQQYKYRNSKDRIFSEEHCNKIRMSRIGRFKGSNNPNWKGGITDKMELLRKSSEYKKWRLDVYSRDWFSCKICTSRKKIHAHHIYPRRDCMEKMFDINNGITLCKECHKKTFFKEYRFIDLFLKIINSKSMAKATV